MVGNNTLKKESNIYEINRERVQLAERIFIGIIYEVPFGVVHRIE